MPCFYPLDATQLLGGEIIIHKRHEKRTPTPITLGRDIKLPCNNCIGCRMQRAQNWATRCLHESQQHEENAFLTLTLRESNYRTPEPGLSTSRHVDSREISARVLHSRSKRPTGANIARVHNSRSRQPESTETLSIKDHQRFIKRLRKEIRQPVRFYMCGEYGEKLGRPHYHYLLFGYNFPDRYYWRKSESGEKIYRSPTLERLWTFGHSEIGEVTYESCAYVAAYVMKKMNGAKAEEHYLRTDEAGNNYWLQPEFNLMSRKPGIAKTWWDEFHLDVYPGDTVIRDGRKQKPPRYYDKLLELFDPRLYESIKLQRARRAAELAGDNSPARLRDKERVAEAQLALKTRQLEKRK